MIATNAHETRHEVPRQVAAVVIGMALAAGSLFMMEWSWSSFCEGSTGQRCSIGIPLVFFGFLLALASPFVLARVSARERWFARGAAGMAALVASAFVTRIVAAALQPELLRPFRLPPYPSEAFFVVSFGVVAAATLWVSDRRMILGRIVATYSLSIIPGMVGHRAIGEHPIVLAALALVGVGLGLTLPTRLLQASTRR